LRKLSLCLLLIILVFTGSTSKAVSADDSEWQPVGPGINFREFQLADPNNVFVARMDRSNPNVTLESSIAQGKVLEGRESVSGMFRRYDQALNQWGISYDPPVWGMRNQVVVAINGSYFDLNTGVPQGGMVQDGWYAKSYDNLGGWGGFAWKLDRSAFISECLYHSPDKQFVTYPATGVTQVIDRVNKPRYTNILVMYTPQYNSQTLNDDSGVEVVVELNQPAMIMPQPAYVSGIVREVRNGHGKTPIPFDSVVLSAVGKSGDILLANATVGSEIRFTQEITSYEADCATSYHLSWTKTYSSIQGAFFFLKNGQVRDFSDIGAARRNPRSAIAFNDQYVYFIVVDGRDYYHSIGMTIRELAEFARDSLGANWGVAQDGGGSSTMVINGSVVNNTYCNIYTCSTYFVPYIPTQSVNYSDEQSDLQATSSVVTSPAGIERTVANGMMMVLVQPAKYSNTYAQGDLVATASTTDLRLGPGTNYASFADIPKDTQGIVLKQTNGLDGVLAKSSYWWYVNFGSITGWVPEQALVYRGVKNNTMDFWEQSWKPHFLTSGFYLNLFR
jgi:Phosphodiester glycosidase